VAVRTDSSSAAPREVVFVVDGSTVRQVEVSIGIQDDEFIQIIKGLKLGQEVVRGPFDAVSRKLEDGSAVTRAKDE
jgi:HlyD family secretion protein